MNLIELFIHTAYAAEEVAHATGPAQLLGLDWKLFIAQLINFLVVLLVLWKWVFGPIGKKLEERANKIEQSQRDIEDISKKHQEAEEYRLAEIEKARNQASEIINQAQKHAETAKQQIMDEAKHSSEKLIAQTKVFLESEKGKLLQEVRNEAASMVALATEKIIGLKLDSEKDKAIIAETLKKTQSYDS